MIYNFDLIDVPELPEIGGKANALIETYKAGFPVPEGIVLSVTFFNEWFKEIKSSKEYKKVLKDTTKETCDIVKAKAAGLRFTDAQNKAFEKGIEDLSRDMFAVRSSSPEEDLEGVSFAGMYETLLGVKRNGLEKAIAEVFSSCFDFRVMEYKKQNGLKLDNTSIAVIVQKQIASEVSGVGFSLNPINNCYDEVVINASFGLGDAIVSGIVTPDSYVVDSIKKEISVKKISEKKISIWLKAGGGTEKKNNKNARVQALDDAQIMELSELIKKCETYYDKPIDIEWAFEKRKLYLLQARPITTYIPFFPELLTMPGEQKKIYADMIVMSQGFTQSMSVLGMELWGRMIETVQGETSTIDVDGTAPTLHGREYINVSYMYKAMGKAFTKQLIKSYDGNIRNIFDTIDLSEYIPKKKPDQLKGMLGKAIVSYFKIVPPLLKAMASNYQETIGAYVDASEKIMAKANKINIDDALSVTVDDMMMELKTFMTASGALIAGMISLSSIKKMFKGYDVESMVAALAMDLEGNPTAAMGCGLYKLACYDEFIKTKTVKDFLDKVEKRKYSDAFMDDYDTFIEEHGFRGFMEIDVASMRMDEDPAILFEKLKNINITDNQITRVKEKKEQTYEDMLAIAKEKGFEKRFIKHVEIYQSTFGYRELPKYVIVYMFAKTREACLRLGEVFVNNDRLEDKTHIFDLRLDEIDRAQKDDNLNLMTLREKNLAPYKAVACVKDWPLVIDSRGKIFKPQIRTEDGDFTGEPIAPGKTRGRAKVLKTPYEKSLNTGEILVTMVTEPSWTPIFINAAGVVMEVGGALQHGGIIAREYGIPCVSGLLGIMDIVKDGDLLEVDGSNGIVKIIKE